MSQLTLEVQRDIQKEVIRYLRGPAAGLILANFTVVVASIIYVFFILPGKAVVEAEAQIRREVAGFTSGILEHAKNALIETGRTAGTVENLTSKAASLSAELSL